MIRIILTFILIFAIEIMHGQTFIDFTDTQRVLLDGVEFGYNISNEQTKKIDNSEVLVLTIQWYLVNKEHFSKILVLAEYTPTREAEVDLKKKICLGRLHIRNALGNKFSYMIQDPNITIEVTRNKIVGKRDKVEAYNLQPGETLSSTVTVQLPKDKKPEVSLLAFLSPAY